MIEAQLLFCISTENNRYKLTCLLEQILQKKVLLFCFFVVASLVKPPHVPPPIGYHVPIISKFHFEGSLDPTRTIVSFIKRTILKVSPTALYSLYEQGAAHPVLLTIFSSGSSENVWYLSPNILKMYGIKDENMSYLYWSKLLHSERET